MKILHLADVHFDSTFRCRSATVREALTRSQFDAFAMAVDCAVRERVDAVLVAGDLLDSDRLTLRTERFLTDQCARLDEARIAVVIVTGNHDPGQHRRRLSQIEWPSSVEVVDSAAPVVVPVRDSTGKTIGHVIAAGHERAHEDRNLAAGFPRRADPMPHVGLLHALVTSAADADRHDRYAPCAAEDLDAVGYDYWALGHVHTRQRVDSSTEAWYPGSVHGRNPSESGPRGGLLVTADTSGVSVDFRPFAPHQWVTISPGDLSEVANLNVLIDRIARSYDEAIAGLDAEGFIVRVDLSGPCPLAAELMRRDDRYELADAVGTRLDVVDVEIRTPGLRSLVDVETHRGEASIVGEVLGLIERLRSDDALLADVAPNDLARVESGAAREAYLRTLLDGMEADAVLRLVEE